jgi:plasmid stabilization system protein ParE
VKLRVGKRAQRQADQIEGWWVGNRPAAPSLFTDELEELFEHIRTIPGAGVRWPTPKRPTLRRILMERTGNHIYFRVDEAKGVVHVIAVWGAPRERGPKLSGPKGSAQVRSAWIVRAGESFPRFVSCYVL